MQEGQNRKTSSLSILAIAGVEPYQEKPGEEYMNEAQLAHFKRILEAWRNQLRDEVDRTVSHMQDEAANFPDPVDRAAQEEEFSLELRNRDRERKLIKKIEKTLKKVGMILLTLFVALILPLCAFLALVSGKIKLDVGMLQRQIVENLSAEDRAMLESIESTMEEIKSAFTEADMPERAGEAQAAYIMALYNQSKEPGFVSRLLSCYQKDATDQQIVDMLNRTFGSRITTE